MSWNGSRFGEAASVMKATFSGLTTTAIRSLPWPSPSHVSSKVLPPISIFLVSSKRSSGLTPSIVSGALACVITFVITHPLAECDIF